MSLKLWADGALMHIKNTLETNYTYFPLIRLVPIILMFKLFSSDIWCMGDSIMYWAGEYAQSRDRTHLGLLHEIEWSAKRGMSWEDFRHHIQLKVVFASAPKVIMIHLGGNDVEKLTICKIFSFIRSGLKYIKAAFPACQIIWIDILPRLQWTQGSTADKKRRRINRYGRQLARVLHGGSVSVEIDSVTPGFFRADRVHLSQVGIEMFLDALKDKLLSIFHT